MGYIRTYTGKIFRFDKICQESIDIEDIAYALSNIVRFGGHARQPYSVAQHSVLVALFCPEEHRLDGLLHDAAEAYIGDIVTPFKKMFPGIKAYENELYAAIADKFGARPAAPPCVKEADRAALLYEFKTFFGDTVEDFGEKVPDGITVKTWSRQMAMSKFLDYFEDYAFGKKA